jgi:Tol biopolymer transport system component
LFTAGVVSDGSDAFSTNRGFDGDVARLRRIVALLTAGATIGLAVVTTSCGSTVEHPDRGAGPRFDTRDSFKSSPNVGTIAYVESATSWSVITLRSDGTHRRRLIAGLGSPAWSPDGRQIAAVDQIVSIYSADGTYRRDLLGGICDEPAWSPTGRQIACVGPIDDRMSNVSTKLGLFLESVTTGSEKIISVEVDEDPSPSWSPDGNRLAFKEGTGLIRILDLRSGRLTTLGPGRSPDWSPRGNVIAYSTGSSIVVSRPDGTHRRTVVTSKTGVDQPSWSPDGGSIVYATLRNGFQGGGLRIVSASGGSARLLTNTGSDPDWKPRG